MFTCGSFRFVLDPRQTSDLRRDFATGVDQIQDQPLIDVERPLILGPIAHVVALGRHAPDFRSQAERVRQQLEDDVALRRPESAGSTEPRRVIAAWNSSFVSETMPPFTPLPACWVVLLFFALRFAICVTPYFDL